MRSLRTRCSTTVAIRLWPEASVTSHAESVNIVGIMGGNICIPLIYICAIRIANPSTSVRFRYPPPEITKDKARYSGLCLLSLHGHYQVAAILCSAILRFAPQSYCAGPEDRPYAHVYSARSCQGLHNHAATCCYYLSSPIRYFGMRYSSPALLHGPRA